MDDFRVITDLEGIRDLRQLRHQLTEREGVSLAGGSAPAPNAPIVVEIDVTFPAGDYEQRAVQQVRYDGTQWVNVREVKVRKISYARLEAGTESNPVRVFARPVGNMGLCITERNTPGTNGNNYEPVEGSCCGCYEPDEYPQYEWEDYPEPVYYTFMPPAIECCNIGNQGFILKRLPGDDAWEGVETDCPGGSGSMHWVLNIEGPTKATLKAVHSTEGIIAYYDRHFADSDPFCAMRFELNESETPGNKRGCMICIRELCINPHRGAPLSPPCFASYPTIHTEFAEEYLFRTKWEHVSGNWNEPEAKGMSNWKEFVLRPHTEFDGDRIWETGYARGTCGWFDSTIPGSSLDNKRLHFYLHHFAVFTSPFDPPDNSMPVTWAFALMGNSNSPYRPVPQIYDNVIVPYTRYVDQVNHGARAQWSDAEFNPLGSNRIEIDCQFFAGGPDGENSFFKVIYEVNAQ